MLGRVSQMRTKSEALKKLSEILQPINSSNQLMNPNQTFKEFVDHVYFPFKRKTWKPDSTAKTTEDRVRFHLVKEFEQRPLSEFRRLELQAFLDTKARTLSFSTVSHLRWDLRAIFRLAVEEDCIHRNPAESLTPDRECKKPIRRVMNNEEVKELLGLLELRERLIVKFALFAGMRPGEIFALRRGSVTATCAEVSQRVYRGSLGTPKTEKSIRLVGLPGGLSRDLSVWLAASQDTGPGGWLFPSEKLKTPIRHDGVWRRHILPKLKEKELAWINFQVLRRTHASAARQVGVDPKVVADQLGHNLDVNLNVYTQTTLERKIEAVEALEAAFTN
jgi:integrase